MKNSMHTFAGFFLVTFVAWSPLFPMNKKATSKLNCDVHLGTIKSYKKLIAAAFLLKKISGQEVLTKIGSKSQKIQDFEDKIKNIPEVSVIPPKQFYWLPQEQQKQQTWRETIWSYVPNMPTISIPYFSAKKEPNIELKKKSLEDFKEFAVAIGEYEFLNPFQHKYAAFWFDHAGDVYDLISEKIILNHKTADEKEFIDAMLYSHDGTMVAIDTVTNSDDEAKNKVYLYDLKDNNKCTEIPYGLLNRFIQIDENTVHVITLDPFNLKIHAFRGNNSPNGFEYEHEANKFIQFEDPRYFLVGTASCISPQHYFLYKAGKEKYTETELTYNEFCHIVGVTGNWLTLWRDGNIEVLDVTTDTIIYSKPYSNDECIQKVEWSADKRMFVVHGLKNMFAYVLGKEPFTIPFTTEYVVHFDQFNRYVAVVHKFEEKKEKIRFYSTVDGKELGDGMEIPIEPRTRGPLENMFYAVLLKDKAQWVDVKTGKPTVTNHVGILDVYADNKGIQLFVLKRDNDNGVIYTVKEGNLREILLASNDPFNDVTEWNRELFVASTKKMILIKNLDAGFPVYIDQAHEAKVFVLSKNNNYLAGVDEKNFTVYDPLNRQKIKEQKFTNDEEARTAGFIDDERKLFLIITTEFCRFFKVNYGE